MFLFYEHFSIPIPWSFSKCKDYTAIVFNQHLISVMKPQSEIRTGTQVTLNHNYTNFNY